MKVLHVISGLDPRGGGTTTALAGMARAQHDQGLDVRVITTHPADFDDTTARQLREHGVEVQLVGPTRTPLALHPRIDPELRRAIAATDIVHIHGLWEQIQHRAARLAQHAQTPYLISPHGMLAPWSLAQSRLKKRLYLVLRLRHNLNHAAALHFASEAERDLAQWPWLAANSLVEPFGIDLDEFTPLPDAGIFREAQPAIGEGPLVLFLGRVHPCKGLEYLIPAMREVTPSNAMLVVAGPDSDGHMRAMRELARSAGVSDRVRFVGMVRGAQRIAALVDADVFCLPSDHENFGVALLEALAAGTPVLVSDQVSIAETIADHGLGEIVPRSPNPIATALTRWLNDDGRDDAFTARSRLFVQEHYDWRHIGRRWVKHYQRVAATFGSPPTPHSE